MKSFFTLLIGTILGIVFVKSEVISWFRIQEMFYFKSIHMYGTFATAIITALIGIMVIKYVDKKNKSEKPIVIHKKKFQKGIIYGGLLFGIGWGFTGACPGPIYTLAGTGEPAIVLILIGVFSGVLSYAFLRNKLPH